MMIGGEPANHGGSEDSYIKKTNQALMVFALMSFVVEMTMFVFNGILDRVVISLNVSLAQSSLLSTVCVYGAAFGVPIALIVFRKSDRSKVLRITLLLTILTTLAFVYAKNFGQLLVTRLAMGISVSSYNVLAISTVAALSSGERRGRSMAFYMMGASMAQVIGIPLTRALLSILDWRGVFWLLNVIMVFSLVYFKTSLPEGDRGSVNVDLRNELRFFGDGEALSVIVCALFIWVGYGAFHTYIAPYLVLLFPSIEPLMSAILVLSGIAGFTGNLAGGYVADRIGYARSMLLGAALEMVLMLMILVFQPVKWLSVILVLLWVMSAWFAGLQIYTGIAQATRNSSFMISVSEAMILLGIAIGSSSAAAVIALSRIHDIVYIVLFASLVSILIQSNSIRRYS